MKYTLLELVQDIMSSMDSEEVNSISDTVESQQVVKVIKTVYNDIISRGDLSYHKVLFNLDASGDASKPTLMTKPDSISNVEWIKYNVEDDEDEDPVWRDIRFLPLKDFMEHTHSFLPSESNVASFSHTASTFTHTFNYYNDRAPSYYTSIDDDTVIFDSYDSEVDSTLQSSKSMGFGTKDLVFVESDTWTPELPANHFALLLNEAKALAWTELKQTPNPKAELSARRNWRHLARTRRQIPFDTPLHADNTFNTIPYYGRK